MIPLRQSTASQEIPLGYFLDSTDGDTEETGLTIANTDIKVWKSGATTLANKNSGGATHISTGIYYAVLDATDTDTVGPMKIFIHVAGALACSLECCVYEEVVFDALYASSAAGFASITALATAQTDLDTITGSDGVTLASAQANTFTESYAADGAAATLPQLLYLIQQSVQEFAIIGTTRTVKKLDGSATAATFTLDDATSPTSTTRAT